jgi:hypothetical protein
MRQDRTCASIAVVVSLCSLVSVQGNQPAVPFELLEQHLIVVKGSVLAEQPAADLPDCRSRSPSPSNIVRRTTIANRTYARAAGRWNGPTAAAESSTARSSVSGLFDRSWSLCWRVYLKKHAGRHLRQRPHKAHNG